MGHRGQRPVIGRQRDGFQSARKVTDAVGPSICGTVMGLAPVRAGGAGSPSDSASLRASRATASAVSAPAR